jgi:putative Holliday junction resolvase
MRVLGIDLGTRRIGLALSDPEAAFAFPLSVLERHGGKRDLEALSALVREREVERIVVGLPLHLDGRNGPEAEAAERFARQLAAATQLPVELVDERWTTVEAERSLREFGHSARRRKAEVDSVAAAILLRTVLDGAATRAVDGAARPAGRAQ